MQNLSQKFTAGNVTFSLSDEAHGGGVQGQLSYIQGSYHAYVDINPVGEPSQDGIRTDVQLKLAKEMLRVGLENNFPGILEVVDADGRNSPSSLGLELRRKKNYPMSDNQAFACLEDNRYMFDYTGRMIQAALSVPMERGADAAEVSHAARAAASKPQGPRTPGQ